MCVFAAIITIIITKRRRKAYRHYYVEIPGRKKTENQNQNKESAERMKTEIHRI